MNPINKKAPGAKGVPQPFNQRAGHTPQSRPAVAQPKTAQSAQSARRPVAPPVYRPEVKRLVQPKTITQQRMPPAAPPVYRPQQQRVAQAKMVGPAQMKNHPAAPPAYRPQPVPRVLQAKETVTQRGGQRQQEQQRVAPPLSLACQPARPRGDAQGAAKIAAHQHGRRGAQIVQRYVDKSNSDISSSGQYIVEHARSHVLYSTLDAAPPQPQGLYARGRDFTAGEFGKVPLNSWTPNVRFIDKREAEAQPVAEKPGTYSYKTSGSFGFESTTTYSIEGLKAEVENPGPGLDGPPLVGALGKNDCNVWAATLQNLIADEKGEAYRIKRGSEPQRNVRIMSASTAELKVKVGDLMKHIYEGEGACRYHAATVVAKDGLSLVTLEGHVSKNLSRPQFHIRSGLLGFAAEGIQHKQGDNVEVVPLTSQSYQEIQGEKKISEARYQEFGNIKPKDWERYKFSYLSIVNGNIGITPTKEKRRRDEAARQLAIIRRAEARRPYDRAMSRSLALPVTGPINTGDEGNNYILNGML